MTEHIWVLTQVLQDSEPIRVRNGIMKRGLQEDDHWNRKHGLIIALLQSPVA